MNLFFQINQELVPWLRTEYSPSVIQNSITDTLTHLQPQYCALSFSEKGKHIIELLEVEEEIYNNSKLSKGNVTAFLGKFIQSTIFIGNEIMIWQGLGPSP